MRKFAFVALILLPALVWAGGFSAKPSMSRQYTLGTKGQACYSTVYKAGAKCKTATAGGVATVAKFYLNDDETYVYPSSEEHVDVTGRNVSKLCQRAYSTATPIYSHCWGE